MGFGLTDTDDARRAANIAAAELAERQRRNAQVAEERGEAERKMTDEIPRHLQKARDAYIEGGEFPFSYLIWPFVRVGNQAQHAQTSAERLIESQYPGVDCEFYFTGGGNAFEPSDTLSMHIKINALPRG